MEGPRVHSKCLAFILFKFWEDGLGSGCGGGWGEGFFSFSLVPNVFPNIILQCVLFHFHLLRPLKPHPPPPPSTKKIKIMTRCSTGNGQWLKKSFRHCPIFVHTNIEKGTLNTKTTPCSHGFKIYCPGQTDRLTELIYKILRLFVGLSLAFLYHEVSCHYEMLKKKSYD